MRTVSGSCLAVLVGLCFLAHSAVAGPKTYPRSGFLQPHFKVGETYKNIFSRAISFKGDGFAELVFRASGSAEYTVTSSDAAHVEFDLQYRYDGRSAGQQKFVINPQTLNPITNGKEAHATDASGLIYNPWLWGETQGNLSVTGAASAWTLKIPAPWELGGAGEETVRVVRLDPAAHEVMLEREGNGTGAFDDERGTLKISVGGQDVTTTVVPGPCHWIGYTIFREGIVVSDALMVTRPLTLQVTGQPDRHADEREYMLLNAMPAS